MTVYPFRPRTTDSLASADPAFDDFDDEFPHDFHTDFADFDDADESMHRYGSHDRQYRYAHRTLSPTVLAALTGIQIPMAQVFHYAFFGLLENVGDFDGLIATPSLLIAGRPERVATATHWLGGHPSPDVPTLLAAADPDEPAGDLDLRITETIEHHSLALVGAVGTNPSLTFGSTAALRDRVIDEILDLVLSCQVDEIERLTDATIDLLRRIPTSIRPLGNATLHPLVPAPQAVGQIPGEVSHQDTT